MDYNQHYVNTLSKYFEIRISVSANLPIYPLNCHHSHSPMPYPQPNGAASIVRLGARVLRKRSLVYGVEGMTHGAAQNSGAAAPSAAPAAAAPAVCLARSPMLRDLYAVLLLGSRDISADELAIYDAFVEARIAAAKFTASSASPPRSAEGELSASPDEGEGEVCAHRQPILICADGSVVNAAVKMLSTASAACTANSSSTDGHNPTSSAAALSLAFDALCGDFDSVPPEILGGLKRSGTSDGDAANDVHTSTLANPPPVGAAATIGSGDGSAAYFHVTALYDNDCQFVSSPNGSASSCPPAYETESFVVSSPLPFTAVHRELREGPAAAALSRALNGRQATVGALAKQGKIRRRSVSSPAVAVPAPPVVVKVDCQMTTDFEKCCQLLELNHLITSAAAESARGGDDAEEEALAVGERCPSGATDTDAPISTITHPLPLPQVLVLGALGGRMDHEFAVLNTLFAYATRLDLSVYNGRNTLFAVPCGTVLAFTRDEAVDGNTIGVVVFGTATSAVVSKGLQWELGPDLKCGFGFVQSTSNAIAGIGIDPSTVDAPTLAAQLEALVGGEVPLNSDEASGPPLSAEELSRSFVVDTRQCGPDTFVLVTIPRRHM